MIYTPCLSIAFHYTQRCVLCPRTHTLSPAHIHTHIISTHTYTHTQNNWQYKYSSPYLINMRVCLIRTPWCVRLCVCMCVFVYVCVRVCVSMCVCVRACAVRVVMMLKAISYANQSKMHTSPEYRTHCVCMLRRRVCVCVCVVVFCVCVLLFLCVHVYMCVFVYRQIKYCVNILLF